MNDARKTKAQLIEELQALRAQVGGDPVGSRRQLAAECVRAEALAMRSSDDLHRVVAVLFREMVAAGIESPCCSAQLYDFDEEGYYDSFAAFTKPPRTAPTVTSDALVDFDEMTGTTHVSYPFAETQAMWGAQFQDGVSRWRAGEPWSVPVTGSEPFSKVFHRLHSQLGFPGGFPGWEGDWVVTNVPFQYGSIAFREREERPEHIDIARQLTQALSIGYRRFLDFQRLEEQNRQLEIEQILERVRGQALGMHKSEDLTAVAVTVFDELRALGVAIWRCGFFIFNDAHDPPEMEAWLTTAEGEPVRARWTYVLDGGAHPYMTGIYGTWKRGEHRCNYLVGDDVGGLANHLIDRGLPFPVGREPGLEDAQVEVWFNYLFFQHGYLHAATLERLPAERLDVLEQLAVIFGVAYTRFLELQQAERHARQAERRAAVDRVRAEIATMRTSADLEHVTPLIWKELADAGVSFFRCGVFIATEEGERVRAYLTNPQGQSLAVLDLAADSHPVMERVLKSWRAEQALTERWDQATFIQWMDFLQAQGQDVDRGRFQGAEQPPESLSLHFVPFAQGMLYVGSAAPLPAADLSLVQEVATAFSVAYARYLDFAQLEGQNRALLVEQALERVRTQVAAMQESAELSKVVDILDESLKRLGNPHDMVGINLVDEDAGVFRNYDSDAQRQQPIHGSEHTSLLYEWWRKKETYIRYWTSADYSRWFRAWEDAQLESVIERERVAENMASWGDRWVVDAPFLHGTVAMNKLGPAPFSGHEVLLLERFTEVFALGYIRYLDLRAAEERAAQVARESAYERVRSAVLASRNTEDILAGVSLMAQELRSLGVRLFACGFNLIDEQAGEFRALFELGQSTREVPYVFDDPDVAEVVAHWRKGKAYMRPARWDEGTMREGEEHGGEEYVRNLQTVKVIVDVPFAYGTLAMNSAEVDAFSQEEISILQGFAEVISLAYTRYLDFQSLAAANQRVQQETRRKSEFLSRMSHDLRTPMNAIIGYTRILSRRLEGSIEDRLFHNLENIQTSADNLLILINEVLDLSRIEAGRIDLKPEPVDLSKLVGECITAVAPLARPGVELRQEVGEVPSLYTDADRIRRAVMNLLGNAVKFTDKGSITVSLKPVASGIELAVADTGVGIPVSDLPHIFEEFRQVTRQVGDQTEGTGLGLAIAAKSVAMLGGTISVASEVGVGTTFTLRLCDCES